jgi:myo-inositol-1-phosphate synthase
VGTDRVEIKNPEGKLGVLIPGLGAVSTTFITGTMLIRNGLSKPIGSLTQMGKIRTGSGDNVKEINIKDYVPLASLNDLEFGGWDIFEDSVYESALNAEVLSRDDVDKVKDELSKIKPWKAVFNRKFVKNLDGKWVKNGATHWENVQLLKDDIAKFKQEKNLNRMVMVWCASTEIYQEIIPGVHDTLENFEKALKDNHPAIAPSMMYCYAALDLGIPYANGAPNLCNDIPALWELADKRKAPMGGKDFKSGQTFMKTVLAPAFKARMLGMNGWFSTNILGNRDGEVLDDPESFKTKEVSKLSVLDQICQPEEYPDLYGEFFHKVTINYYPPRGDNKEGWDNVDIFGWLGYPMQVKVNFLCRDSILAAPIVLDLTIFFDLAQRAGLYGNQEWLSFYWKSPMHPPKKEAEHDLFVQLMKLKNKLRMLKNEPAPNDGNESYS